MTEEGLRGDPMDEAEVVAAMKNMALMVRTFYEGLLEAGFEAQDAMRLTSAYVVGSAGGKAA